MLNRKVRKFASLLLACVLLVTCSIPALAADTTTPVTPIDTENISVGSLIASGVGECDNGSGSFEVYLDSGDFWTDVMMGTASTGVNGAVTCYVQLPNGSTQALGTINASGDSTPTTEIFYCPAGTYTFFYSATTSAHIELYARMYD